MSSPFSELTARIVPTWETDPVISSTFSDSSARIVEDWELLGDLDKLTTFVPFNPFGTFEIDLGFGSGGFGDLPFGDNEIGEITIGTTWTDYTTR